MSTRRTCDMTTGASGVLTVANIRDWGCEPLGSWDIAEETGQIDIAIDFYQTSLPNPIRRVITVSNTISGRLQRNASPTGMDDLILRDTLSTAGAFTAALSGWKGGATKNARQKGLADALIAAGIIHSNLGGTTS